MSDFSRMGCRALPQKEGSVTFYDNRIADSFLEGGVGRTLFHCFALDERPIPIES
jgi:hypothetical protein